MLLVALKIAVERAVVAEAEGKLFASLAQAARTSALKIWPSTTKTQVVSVKEKYSWSRKRQEPAEGRRECSSEA